MIIKFFLLFRNKINMYTMAIWLGPIFVSCLIMLVAIIALCENCNIHAGSNASMERRSCHLQWRGWLFNNLYALCMLINRLKTKPTDYEWLIPPTCPRLRRWSNIVQMLYKCFVFTGVLIVPGAGALG